MMLAEIKYNNIFRARQYSKLGVKRVILDITDPVRKDDKFLNHNNQQRNKGCNFNSNEFCLDILV